VVEDVPAALPAYEDLIRETFIKPIRSLLVVDDEYPTIDGYLGAAGEPKEVPPDSEGANKLRQILQFARSTDQRWLVDVHDGDNISFDGEKDVAPHLHQSDLLILDFQLDQSDDGGVKALNILKHLSKNNHFNLVIVYTNDNKKDVLRKVVMSQMQPGSQIDAGRRDEIFDLLDKATDDLAKSPDDFLHCISSDEYLAFRRSMSNFSGDEDFWKSADRSHKEIGDPSISREAFRELVIDNFERQYADLFATVAASSFPDWSQVEAEDQPAWLRTSQLFVTVVEKKDVEPKALVGELVRALSAWEPSPHRLILSKVRSLLDEQGVAAEDEVLSDRTALAGWFETLMKADEGRRRIEAEELIQRNWETLFPPMKAELVDFSDRLVAAAAQLGSAQNAAERFYGVDLSDPEQLLDARRRQNALVCSLPPSGLNLVTGHVLQIGAEFWAVLSPACDLVPGQSLGGWNANVHPCRTFTGLKLHERADGDKSVKNIIKDASENDWVFLWVFNDLKEFQWKKNKANPHREEFFAKNDGQVDPDTLTLEVGRLTTAEGGALSVTFQVARVVAQLRYEYALNLLQRLGGSMTRVGLNFVDL